MSTINQSVGIEGTEPPKRRALPRSGGPPEGFSLA